MRVRIVKLLEKQGYHFYKEVKVLTRTIDIVAIKRKHVLAIEVKVENWKQALKQALTCRLCAHEVYIAIWKDFQQRIPKELLKKFRIGLIVVSEEGAIILYKPKKSQITHKNILNEMLSMN